MAEVDDAPLKWRTSSKSAQTNCVEVAECDGRVEHDGRVVLIRNSKNPDAGTLTVPLEDFRAFIDGIKTGDFDPF